MSDSKSVIGSAEEMPDAMWARIDDGRWYAIPSSMAEPFRKAGAAYGARYQDGILERTR